MSGLRSLMRGFLISATTSLLTLPVFAEGSWRTFIPASDTMAMLKLGAPREEVMEQVAGLAASTRCAGEGDTEVCRVAVVGIDWFKVKPARSDSEMLLIFFRDGYLAGIMYVAAFDDFQAAEVAYYEARSALMVAGLVSKNADKERLRALSGTIPGHIVRGAEWMSGAERRGLSWLLKRRGTGSVITALGNMPEDALTD
jgi:hypothetical protein